jgi:hypothetical protein
MKYILYKDIHGQFLPIIFPEALVHGEVDEALRRRSRVLVGRDIHSAGFTTMVAISTHGESETLDIKSNELDADVINASGYGWNENSIPLETVAKPVRLRSVEMLLESVGE